MIRMLWEKYLEIAEPYRVFCPQTIAPSGTIYGKATVGHPAHRTRKAGISKASDRALYIHCVAIPRVAISDDREGLCCFVQALANGHHLAVREQACVWKGGGGCGDAKSRHEGKREARIFDELG
jgi:hypothetical protein